MAEVKEQQPATPATPDMNKWPYGHGPAVKRITDKIRARGRRKGTRAAKAAQ